MENREELYETGEFFSILIKKTISNLLNSIPIFGQVIVSAIDTMEDLKRKRIEDFLIKFSDFLKDNYDKYEEEYKKRNKDENWKENFAEIFFYIVESVVRTRSEKKREIFARILFKEFTGTVKTDFNRIFLEIISQIDEKEIEILGKLREIREEATKEVKKVNKDKKIDKDTYLNEVYLNKIYNVLDNIEKIFEISKELYNFYIQDLISKSLVIDESMKTWDAKPLEIVKITNFGINFLRYIEDV